MASFTLETRNGTRREIAGKTGVTLMNLKTAVERLAPCVFSDFAL